MVIYINSKNRLQIKSINFNIFTYSLELYEKLIFKKCFVKIPNDLNMLYKIASHMYKLEPKIYK